MKFLHVICLTLSMLWGMSLQAQPANNTCDQALELTDLDGNCEFYAFRNATFHLRNGSCSPTFARNVWFKFTAQGTDLDLEVNTNNGPPAYIGVYEMLSPLCSPQTTFELGCDTNQILLQNALVIGETYYISVAMPTNYQDLFSMCIDNPIINMDPPNDYKCFPELVEANGDCTEGTTVNATFDFNNSFCPFADERSVWYETIIASGKNRIEAKISNLETDAEVAIMIGTYPNNDCVQSFQELDGACFDSTGTTTFTGLIPGKRYFIMVSHRENDGQEFELCLTEKGPNNGCAVNNTCNIAEIISLQTDDGEVCVPGCNWGASPGPTMFPSTCYFMSSPTVWYEFTTDDIAGFLKLEVTSDTLRFPQVGIYRGDNCMLTDTLLCQRGNNKELSVIGQVLPNTTYKIALTDLSGRQGNFEMCLELISDPQECAQQDTLYATETSFGSPLEGPYQSGETVRFRYELTQWNKDNCNRLSAIVPTFGTAWDPASFDSERKPNVLEDPRPVSSGQWEWYPRGAVRYNYDNPSKGYLKGTPLPAGWYFVSNSAPPNSPNSSIGDGVSCKNDSTETWSVEFEVTAFDGEDCPPGINAPADVGMLTFGDGETGVGQYRGCDLDEPFQLNPTVQCCESPEVSIQPTQRRLCSGESARIDFRSNEELQEVFWVVKESNRLVSPDPGRGLLFSQQLFLIPGFPEGSVTFTFFPRDTLGCVGEGIDVTYTVYLPVDADAGQDRTLCQGETAILGGNPTAGGGTGNNYQYVWTGPVPDVANPEVTVTTGPTTYYLRVIDPIAGCENTDSVTITGLPRPGLQFTGIEEVCVGKQGTVEFELLGTPPYHFIVEAGNFLSDTLTGYNQNTYSLNYDAEEDFEIEVQLVSDANCTVNLIYNEEVEVLPPTQRVLNETLCIGETFEIGGQTFDRSGTYDLYIESPGTEDCDQEVTLNLQILSEIVVQSQRVVYDENKEEGFIKVSIAGGLPPYTYEWSNGGTTDSIGGLSQGQYTLTVTDNNDCQNTFEFEIISTSAFAQSVRPLQSYPNPVAANEKLKMEGAISSGSDYQILWVDARGQVRQGHLLNDSGGQLQLRAPSLPGSYQLYVLDRDEGKAFTDRIIVIR